jgi:hypothetical protein
LQPVAAEWAIGFTGGVILGVDTAFDFRARGDRRTALRKFRLSMVMTVGTGNMVNAHPKYELREMAEPWPYSIGDGDDMVYGGGRKRMRVVEL